MTDGSDRQAGNPRTKEATILELNARLAQRERELAWLLEMDRIQDQTVDMTRLLTQATEVLVQALDTDLCFTGLTDIDSGEIELKSVSDRMQLLSHVEPGQIHELLEQAWTLDEMSLLVPHESLVAQGVNSVLGVPLVIHKDDRLGAIVLACRDRDFTAGDVNVARAVASQMDSAIVHARAEQRLKRRNLELETLYRVDRIRDQGLDFDEMLSAVLAELCAVIEAEIGFIMLFDTEGRQLELRASTDEDLLTSVGHQRLIDQAANHVLHTGELYVAQDVSGWLRSIMCVPLILRERIIGVFGVVNRQGSRSFSTEDRRLLLAITSQVDTAIFESLDKQRIRETFRRYVGPQVMERMLAMPERDFLKGERSELTVIFTDLRGFTRISERVPPDVLVEMLNSHLGSMTEIVLAYDGTLDKFVADQVVAIMGAPLPLADHALCAVKAAVDMQAAHQELIAYWAERGYSLPPMGIGISTGEMLVGNIGCELQLDYTVIGAEVNLASRLCDVAAADQVLISGRTYERVSEHVDARMTPPLDLDGIQEPVHAYEVLAVHNKQRPEPT